MNPAVAPSASPRRRGSVIVVVLITLMLASLMLVKFMETSEVELVLATRAADQERLKADAFAALETALAVMAEIREIDDGKLHAPAQGWSDPYAYAGEVPREGVTVAFEFKDESGRISLPTLSFDDLQLLARSLGLEDLDARRFADGLFTWMKADHIPQDFAAEASVYERTELPHKPPLRSLRSWEELRAVAVARDYVYDEDGALTAFGSALRENLSLYRYEGANINAITPGWLAMRQWDDAKIAGLAGYRDGLASRPAGAPPWFRDAQEVQAIAGRNTDLTGLDAEAKLVRVFISLKEGAATLRLNALVALDRNIALPDAVAAEGPSATPATPAPVATPTPAPGARAGAGGATAGGETLNYPFRILELVFDSVPAPLLVEEPEETSL